MPIKNLTNNQTNPAAGLRRLALIKKGEFNGTRPIDLDYFRVVWADEHLPTPDPDLEIVRGIFYALYGVEPKRFDNAFFLLNDPQDAFYLEDWIKAGEVGKLVRRCDGETQISHYDFTGKRMLHNPIPCIQGAQEGCNCRAVGRLPFILRDVSNSTGVLGYFQLQLGGKHEIANISAHLAGIQRMVNRPLFTIPFSIFRQDVPINVPGMIKRMDKSLVHIQANPAALQNALMIGGDQPMELEAGELPLDIDDVIEGEIQSSKLAEKRPKSLLEQAEKWVVNRPCTTMDMLRIYLNDLAAESTATGTFIDEGRAANIGKELSMVFRSNDIRAFFLEKVFDIVPDEEGRLSRYLTVKQFDALKKWKNLAEVSAAILQDEVDMVIAAYEEERG